MSAKSRFSRFQGGSIETSSTGTSSSSSSTGTSVSAKAPSNAAQAERAEQQGKVEEAGFLDQLDAGVEVGPGAGKGQGARGGGAAEPGPTDPHTGLGADDVQQIAERGATGSGGPLPHADRIQASFGDYDISGVRAHTDREAAAAIGAEAYSAGADVVFSRSPSVRTAAEEATHSLLQGAGKGPASGVGMEGDSFEVHADEVAKRVERGQSAVDLLDRMTGGDRSVKPGKKVGVQREAAPPRAAEPAEEKGPEAPSTVSIGTPAGAIVVDVPEGAQAGATVVVTPRKVPIRGLTISTMSVQFDPNFNVVGGNADVQVKRGPVEGGGQLNIVNGQLVGEVAVTVDTALCPGQGFASLTEAGLDASGTIAAADLKLANGLTAEGGTIAWTQTVEGGVVADGDVQGQIPNLGRYGMGLHYEEGTVSGQATVELQERRIVGSAKVLSGKLTGAYTDSGEMVLEGPLSLGIGSWAKGDTDGSFNVSTRSLTGKGKVQVQDVRLGQVALHSGTIEAGVESDTWAGGGVEVDASAADFRGRVAGSFDPASDRIDGTMAATYAPSAQGQDEAGSVQILGASGSLTIEQNTPTSLEDASAKVGIAIAGQPRKVEASVEGMRYDVAAKTISGRAQGATTGPVALAGGRLELELGSATAEIQQNTVTDVEGAGAVRVGPGEGDKVLQLDGQATVQVQQGNVSEASGSVSLIQAPLELGVDARITALTGSGVVRDNALESSAMEAAWEADVFGGKAQGAFDVEARRLDGTLQAEVQRPKELGAGTTIDSGRGELEVAENAPRSFKGSAAGKIASKLKYEAQNVDMDVEAGKLGGEAEVGLLDGQEVGLQRVGKIQDLRARGQMTDNEVQRVEGELGGVFEPGGDPLLGFSLSGAFRATDEVVERAEGQVSLEGEKELGPLTLDRLDARATVEENEPSIESATVGFHTDSFQGSIEETSFDLDKKSIDGKAKASLRAPVKLGALSLTKADGELDVENNTPGTMTGAVEGEVQKGDKALRFAAQNVEVDLQKEKVSGTVQASTTEHFDVVPGVLRAKLEDAQGDIEDNDLKKLSGGIDARVGKGGEERLKVAATGEYDAEQEQIVEAEGEVELLQPFSLFSDRLAVKEFGGSGSIVSNELQQGQVSARAEVDAFPGTSTINATLDGSFKQGDDGFEVAGSAEIEQFDLIPKNEKGRQLSGSLAGDVDTAQEQFAVKGTMDYAINEAFGGSLEASMDQEFDPGLKGSLRGEADLVRAQPNFFTIQQTIVSVPLPPIFGASLDAELSMGVSDLSVSPEIRITDEWKPLSEASDLPDFETTTNGRWGVQLEGALVPYLYGGLRMAGIVAAVGGMGKAALRADAGIDAEVQLAGQNDEFSGEVGLGVDISGNLDLSAGLFAKLGISGWKEVGWERDDMVSYTLDDLFNLDWSSTFTFGDSGPGEKEGADVPTTTLQPRQERSQTSEATVEKRPSVSSSSSASASVAGGPKVEGASALEALNREGSKKASGDEEMGGLERAMRALEAMKALYDSVGGAVTQLANVPVGVFQLIWDIFKGKYDFDKIKSDAQEVYAALSDLTEYVAPMVEGWFSQFWEFIKNGPPNLLKALWGDSAAFRNIINDGVTIEAAPAEMLTHLLEGALWDDIFTTAADERAALTVLRVAVRRGMVDTILTPERTRKIFEELDTHGEAFKQLVIDHAPANVLRAEVERYTGRLFLTAGAEREALVWIEAANRRGILRSVLTEDAARDIFKGMDGDRRRRMEAILRDAGYRL